MTYYHLQCPVVLMHGYRDDPSVKSCSVWKDTEAMLKVHKISTLIVEMPRLASIKQRSDKCIEQIRAKYGGRTVHLIAHSMGGLNAVDIAGRSSKDRGFNVKTVTTYGTPHGGVPILDRIFASPVVDIGYTVLLVLHKLFSHCESDHGALRDLTCESTKAFGAKIWYNPEVYYFSWAGEVLSITPHKYSPIQPFIHSDGPNDGVVSTRSAKGGDQFHFLGILKGVDHATMMGSTNVELSLSYLADAEMNRKVIIKPVDNELCTRVKRRLTAVRFQI